MATVTYVLQGYCRTVSPDRAALDDPEEWFACRTYTRLVRQRPDVIKLRRAISAQKIRTYGLDRA